MTPLRSLAWALSTCQAPIEFGASDVGGRSHQIGVADDGRVAVELAGTSDGGLATATIAGTVDGPLWALEEDSPFWAAFRVVVEAQDREAVAWLRETVPEVLQTGIARRARIGGVRQRSAIACLEDGLCVMVKVGIHQLRVVL